MLPKTNRLPLRFSRTYVEAEGQTYHSPLFTFIVAPSMVGQDSPSRFSFIVSKKISKNAPQRNLIKRRLSSSLTPLIPSIKTGFDGIFFVKPLIQDSSPQELNTQLVNILNRSGIING